MNYASLFKLLIYIPGVIFLMLLYFTTIHVFLKDQHKKISPRIIDEIPFKTPYSEDSPYSDPPQSVKMCPLEPSNLVGKLEINMNITLEESEKALKNVVQPGGIYKPLHCIPRFRVAILVGFRDRDQHLGPFTYHMHPFLQKQLLDYRIYIINQTDTKPFNKAKLFNAGYLESMKDGHYDCYVFHDVDFLPENDRNFYHCSDMPRHLTVYYKNHPYPNDKALEKYFGGAVMLNGGHMKIINGWSNLFWGWGGEDDEIKMRILKHNLTIWRYPKTVGLYFMLPHRASPKNPLRFKILKKSKKKMEQDGLNTLEYKLDSRINHPLFTSINVDLS